MTIDTDYDFDVNVTKYKESPNELYLIVKFDAKKDAVSGMDITLNLEADANVYRYKSGKLTLLGTTDENGKYTVSFTTDELGHLKQYLFEDKAGNYSKILKIYEKFKK